MRNSHYSIHMSSLSFHTFSSNLQRARHNIERILELGPHEEPEQVCQQPPKKFPGLVDRGLAALGPGVSYDLPTLCSDQPTRWRREAPRKAEVCVVGVSHDFLDGRGFRTRRWCVDS